MAAEHPIALREWEHRGLVSGTVQMLCRPVLPRVRYRLRRVLGTGLPGEDPVSWYDSTYREPRKRKLISRYGYPGDRLWCQEDYAVLPGKPPVVTYRWDALSGDNTVTWMNGGGMPRWASRRQLLITSLYPARVRMVPWADLQRLGCRGDGETKTSLLEEFRQRWLADNKQLSWDCNDVVWLIGVQPATTG